jgi:hypothetical protein
LITGLGFYTHLPWVGVAVLVGMTVLVFIYRQPSRPLRFFFLFAGIVLLLLLPFLLEIWRDGYGRYFLYLWTFGTAEPLSKKLEVAFAYFQVLFWGVGIKFYTYQPVWGGFLNPVLGSLFLLGLLEAVKNRRNPLYLWLLASFILLMLQGLLTRELEPLRILPLLVPAAALVTLGAVHLLQDLPPLSSVFFALLLFLSSLALDGFHLFHSYRSLWSETRHWKGYAKSLERYQAFELLKVKAKSEGPGLIFADFTTGLSDQSLAVAAHSFDAVQNPALDFDKAKWAAVLVNANYRPFLSKRFVEGKAYWLSKNSSDPAGGWMLWVTPVTDAHREDFRRWRSAEGALAPFIDQNLSYVRGKPYEILVATLQGAGEAFQGDPFLESCYWEKMADTLFKAGEASLEKSEEALQTAVLRGYPAAHLYRQLGIIRLMRQDGAGAQKAFQSSVNAPLNFTDSSRYLKQPGKEPALKSARPAGEPGSKPEF